MRKKLAITMLAWLQAFAADCIEPAPWQALHFSTRDGLATNVVNTAMQDRQGYIWFGTNYGLTRYDGYSFVNFNYEQQGVPRVVNVKAIAEDTDHDRLLVEVSQYPILTFDLQTMRFVEAIDSQMAGPVDKRPEVGRDIAVRLGFESRNMTGRRQTFHKATLDDGQEIYSTNDNGFFVYNPQTGLSTHYSTNSEHPLLESDYVTDVMKDRSGCVWLTTYMGGIYQLRTKSDLRYHMLTDNKTSDQANSVRAFAQLSANEVAVSNMDGSIFRYHLDNGQLEPMAKMGQRVYAMATDSKGRFWIGTRGGGLWIDQQQLTEESGFTARQIYDIVFGKDRSVWIATLDQGLIRGWETTGGHWTFENLLPGKLHELDMDGSGRLWMAAEDGIYVMDADSIHHVYNESSTVCVCHTPQGEVLAGSIGRGLLCMRYDNGHADYRFVTTNDGLANNSVKAIATDDQQNIVVATDGGVSVISREDQTIHNWYSSNGLLSDAYNENAILKTTDGTILLGSLDGFAELRIPSQAAGKTATKDNLCITCIEINDEPLLQRDFRHLRLTYKQNNLRINFSAFRFADQPSVIYSYWLEKPQGGRLFADRGHDQDWKQPTKQNEALYNNLAPGHYRFHLRSGTAGNKWSGETTLDIYIAEPWWNTWWAWTLNFLAVTAIVIYVVVTLRRIFRLHNSLEMERRVRDFQMDFYDRIEQEFRNPLNVLRGATEQVKTTGASKTTVQSIRRGSKRLVKLMEMMQEFRHGQHVEMEKEAMHAEAERRFQAITEAIHAEEEEMKELAPPPLNEGCILIVEPDEDNLTQLASTLNAYFRIENCRRFDIPDEQLATADLSLIVIDISANVQAGRELTRALRRNEHTKAVPIIHLSALADVDSEVGSLRSGADDYIVKPCSGKLLKERVLRCIRRSQSKEPAAAAATPTDEASTLITNDHDRRFLNTLDHVIAANLSDPTFDVNRMADKMGYSRAQLTNKVKQMKGVTPLELLRGKRLERAALLLREEHLSVGEVMARVGLADPGSFHRRFRERFGISPSQYGKKR